MHLHRATCSFETYESNWAYPMRYMVDREITGRTACHKSRTLPALHFPTA